MSKKRRPAPPPFADRRRKPARRVGPPEWVMPVSLAVGGVVVLTIIVFAVVLFTRSGQTLTGGAGPTATGQTINGIQCQTQEQVLFHIHAHLAISVNGQARKVPAGIGIPDPVTQNTTEGPFVVSGTCFYWLHSHAEDGVIHVESPVQRTFTLGDYFDIWGQPLSATQVGADKGTVTAYVNGQRHTGNPRDIPLEAHAVIQLNVGQDVSPKPYTFANGL
ncbi:MAG TPA: hypothetical protein VIC57_19740 [Candidatus Dormibacteraeota bacterium]